MNYLGIDYGRKRVGLGYADGELCVAVPIPAIVNKQAGEVYTQIGEIIKTRRVSELVIGYPLHMDGRVGKRTEEVDQFVRGLENRFGLKVHKVDERLSTSKVESDFRMMGKKVSKKSGEIDSSAATLILQDFLGSQNPQPLSPDFGYEDE